MLFSGKMLFEYKFDFLLFCEKPWRENTLHANILKPSVDRITFKWIDRDLDFDTWKKTASSSKQMTAPPVTIHAAGETLRAEQEEYQRAEFEKWKKKLVVDDTRFYTHRFFLVILKVFETVNSFKLAFFNFL